MSPAFLLLPLFALIASQLFYAFWPYSSRNYPAILMLSAVGFAVGQLWGFAGLPSFRLGEGNLLPGLLFAAALQPLAPRLAIHFR